MEQIKDIAFKMGLITTQDLRVYTTLELLMKIIEKMNELIEASNQLSEEVKQALQAMMDKINYLLNQGLQDEVEKQLNQWLADGTLAELINETIFNELNDKVDKVVNYQNLQMINVLDYCKTQYDNHEDCSTGFNQAISKAMSIGCNTIFIPRGSMSYLIGSTVNLPSDFKVISNGATLTTVMKSTTEGYSYPTCIFRASNKSNISISGIKFDGNARSGSFGLTTDSVENLVEFNNVTDLEFKKCQLYDVAVSWNTSPTMFDEIGVVKFKHCQRVLFEDIVFSESRYEGMMFSYCSDVLINRVYTNNSRVWTALHCWYCQDVNIKESSFIDTNESPGSTLNLQSSNMVFKNNYISGGKGLDISNEAQPEFECRNVKIIDNVIETKYFGIYMPHTANLDVKQLTITGNMITTNDHCMQLSRLYDSVISGNKLTTLVTGDTLRLGQVFDTTISENIITSPNNGIYADIMERTTISKNVGEIGVNGVHLNINANVVNVIENTFTGVERGVYINIQKLSNYETKYHNLNILNNNIVCHAIGTVTSYNGGSSGVHFHVRSSSDTGSQLTNVTIQGNSVKGAEGSYVYMTPDGTLGLVRNISIKDNNFESTTNGCERSISLFLVQNLMLTGNNIFDPKGAITLSKGLGSMQILNNSLSFIRTQMVTNGYLIRENSGRAIVSGNICSKTNYVHFTDGDNANTWTEKLLKDNLPNTYGGTLGN